MRRMSFSMTERQLLNGSKTVTRRLGWKFLRPGDKLLAVRKCMGLAKGERQHVLGEITVVSVCREPLNRITLSDVGREGFGREHSPSSFICMFCRAMKCPPVALVTRIEFDFKRVEGRKEIT